MSAGRFLTSLTLNSSGVTPRLRGGCVFIFVGVDLSISNRQLAAIAYPPGPPHHRGSASPSQRLSCSTMASIIAVTSLLSTRA